MCSPPCNPYPWPLISRLLISETSLACNATRAVPITLVPRQAGMYSVHWMWNNTRQVLPLICFHRKGPIQPLLRLSTFCHPPALLPSPCPPTSSSWGLSILSFSNRLFQFMTSTLCLKETHHESCPLSNTRKGGWWMNRKKTALNSGRGVKWVLRGEELLYVSKDRF